ncbi:hypothetical protein [Mycetocola spongiae]|uniref:hypothetical protein n=1 Tax=Mycetocola spongiae TaxID=2859226 RepID=UPI001CF2CD64|nr:hypothetical protein [Mycetocola spongiae]UCR88184.1 hypothetical protein KXZ72_09305 [Mycetocola spongiae]
MDPHRSTAPPTLDRALFWVQWMMPLLIAVILIAIPRGGYGAGLDRLLPLLAYGLVTPAVLLAYPGALRARAVPPRLFYPQIAIWVVLVVQAALLSNNADRFDFNLFTSLALGLGLNILVAVAVLFASLRAALAVARLWGVGPRPVGGGRITLHILPLLLGVGIAILSTQFWYQPSLGSLWALIQAPIYAVSTGPFLAISLVLWAAYRGRNLPPRFGLLLGIAVGLFLLQELFHTLSMLLLINGGVLGPDLPGRELLGGFATLVELSAWVLAILALSLLLRGLGVGPVAAGPAQNRALSAPHPVLESVIRVGQWVAVPGIPLYLILGRQIFGGLGWYSVLLIMISPLIIIALLIAPIITSIPSRRKRALGPVYVIGTLALWAGVFLAGLFIRDAGDGPPEAHILDGVIPVDVSESLMYLFAMIAILAWLGTLVGLALAPAAAAPGAPPPGGPAQQFPAPAQQFPAPGQQSPPPAYGPAEHGSAPAPGENNTPGAAR